MRWARPFESRIEYEPNTGCWLWSGAVDACGYGRINVAGHTRRAHRIAYIEARGAIPPGLEVLHRCDTPCCVNPEHLTTGTHAANMADMAAKGRAASKSGPRNGRAKISPSLAAEIRTSEADAQSLAAELGLHFCTIYRIRRSKHWTMESQL